MRPVSKSLKEYLRGGVGGLLFSLPMLYTMEVWWHGFTAPPWHLLAYLLSTILLLLAFNRYAGLRRDAGFTEVAIDSVEELGLGLIVAAVVLWSIGQLGAGTSASEAVGKIVVEGMAAAMGVAIGTAQLGIEKGDGGTDGDEEQEEHPQFWHQLALSVCGAVIVSANLAPTEEIVVIAAQTDPHQHLAMAAFALALAGSVVYYLDFVGSHRFREADARTVITGTVMTYAIALVTGAWLLWLFGQFDGLAPATIVAAVVVLGVPATLGASAGRLLLQS